MHRAGGIGRYVFDVDLVALAQVRVAVRRAGGENVAEPRAPDLAAQAEIDESGSGDRGVDHVRVRGQRRGHTFREVSRLHAGRLRVHQRDIARNLAVARIPRRLDGEIRAVGDGGLPGLFQSDDEGVLDKLPHGLEYVHFGLRRSCDTAGSP